MAGGEMQKKALLGAVCVLLVASVSAEAHRTAKRSVHRPRCVDGARCHEASEGSSDSAGAAASCLATTMRSHGGPILKRASIQVVFWGPRWTSSPGDVVSGVDRFLKGLTDPASTYLATVSEYAGSNGAIGRASYVGYTIDSTSPPWPQNEPWPNAPNSNSYEAALEAAVRAKVCEQQLHDTTGNAFVIVIVARKWPGTSYCAWHSATTCGSVRVQYAFVWGSPGGSPTYGGVTCAFNQPYSVGHSDALAIVTNNIGHELAEGLTDPDGGGGWYDACGEECGDKCAYLFPRPVKFADGSRWWLQPEWSNRAFAAGTGIANSEGQKGCILTG